MHIDVGRTVCRVVPRVRHITAVVEHSLVASKKFKAGEMDYRNTRTFDYIVLGAGVNGSAAAYSLAKRGKHVLLLEKFKLPHTRGSSHGQSRIIRLMYKDLIYAQMTQDAFGKWKAIEKETGEQLLVQNGMVQIEREGSANIDVYLQNFRTLGAEVQLMNGAELQAKVPMLSLPPGYVALYEPGGGMLVANKCVLAMQKLFATHGGIIHDEEPVTKIVPGSRVRVETSKASYEAGGLILTLGAWTGSICEQLGLKLPLQPVGVHACYWKVEDPELASTKHFPSFVLGEPYFTYGLAAYDYPGMVKICNHWGTPVNPDVRDDTPEMGNLKSFIGAFLKGVELRPTVIENCLYTDTPDSHFILDRHPSHPNIVIGAPCCGTGFKKAPVTGEVLADLACGLTPKYDISLFRIGRFGNIIKGHSSL